MELTGPVVATIAALAICVLNAYLGYVIAKSVFGKDLKVFLGVVFGSMGGRLCLSLVLMWVCLGPLDMHQVAFAVTFAIGSFLAVMGEALFFHYWHDRNKPRAPVTNNLKKKDESVMFAAIMI